MEPRFHHLAGGIDTKIIPDSAPKIQCLSEPMIPIFHLKKSFCRQYHFDIKAKYEMYFSYSKKSYFIDIFSIYVAMHLRLSFIPYEKHPLAFPLQHAHVYRELWHAGFI